MKKLIHKLLREGLIKEYIGNDIVSLRRYLSMSDEEKTQYLPHEYPYSFEEFLGEQDIDSPIQGEPYEIMDELETQYPDMFNEYASWLFQKIKNHTLDVPDADYPAWSFFEKPSLVKNQWLIHFTQDADGIASQGFTQGIDDMSKLGLTTHLDDFEKQFGGYNFAYTLDDYERYAKANSRTFKYGEEAVIFRASGIKAWHYADQEPQVIFYGNTAKDIIPITESYGDYYIRNKNGSEIFKNEEFNRVVEWVVKNYVQYRKHL